MPRITEMYCFAVSDKDEDDEGVPAVDTIMGPMPLVGADIRRLEWLLPHVQAVADETGKQLRIYKFSNRTQIGEVNPRTDSDSRNPWPVLGLQSPSDASHKPRGGLQRAEANRGPETWNWPILNTRSIWCWRRQR